MKKIVLVLLVMTSAALNAGWDKTYGGEGNDYGHSVIQTDDGGFLIAGASSSHGAISYLITKCWLLKLDSDGDMEWEYAFGTKDKKEGFHTIDRTADGNYILGGWVENYRMSLMKFDESGNVLWDTTYMDNLASDILNVMANPNGDIIFSGKGGKNIVRTDKDGNWLDSANYEESVYDFIPTDDGGFIAVGENIKFNEGFTYDTYPLILRLDPGFNLIWQINFDDEIQGGYSSVIETNDGNYIAIGDKIIENNEHLKIKSYIITKFDIEGNVLWERPGPDGSGGEALIQFLDGYLMAGDILNENYPDNYVALLDPEGFVVWDTSYGGPDQDYPADILLKGTELIVIGQTGSFGAGLIDMHIASINLEKIPTSVEAIQLKSAGTAQNFPNPFSRKTIVRVTCSDTYPGNIRMLLYDEAGRFVRCIEGFQGTNGNYSRPIAADDLKAGVYYYMVETGRGSFSGKMQIIK